MDKVSCIVSQKLEAMAKPASLYHLLLSKHKAVSALFPHIVYCIEHGDHPTMVDAFTHAVRVLRSRYLIWGHVETFVTTLFNKPSTPSLDWTIVLASPHIPCFNMLHGKGVVVRWVAAATATPYTEYVGRSVVGALLHIASIDHLLPHLPVDVWAWLKKVPSLPPQCSGRSWGSKRAVVCQVRALGDIEVLKAYLLLIWSEWDCISALGWDFVASLQQHIPTRQSGLTEMQASLREDFSGIRMGHHRKDLIDRLDHILEQLDRGLGHLEQHKPGVNECYIKMAKEEYEGLRRVLLEIEGEAADTLARMFHRLILFHLLIPVVVCRIQFNLHVCSATPMSMILCSNYLPHLYSDSHCHY